MDKVILLAMSCGFKFVFYKKCELVVCDHIKERKKGKKYIFKCNYYYFTYNALHLNEKQK